MSYGHVIIRMDDSALEYVANDFRHSHASNEDGHKVCIPCMALEILNGRGIDVRDTAELTALTPDGPIQTVEKRHD